MSAFLDIFMTIFNFMKNTSILSFSIGNWSGSVTFLDIFMGTAIAYFGIRVLHIIFGWEE